MSRLRFFRRPLAVLLGALAAQVLAVTGAIDVDPDGVLGEAVEDGGSQDGITEVAAPFGKTDVRAHGGGAPILVAPVEEVEHAVGGRGLVVALSDVTKSDVIEDEQIGSGPGGETAFVASIC